MFSESSVSDTLANCAPDRIQSQLRRRIWRAVASIPHDAARLLYKHHDIEGSPPAVSGRGFVASAAGKGAGRNPRNRLRSRTIYRDPAATASGVRYID